MFAKVLFTYAISWLKLCIRMITNEFKLVYLLTSDVNKRDIILLGANYRKLTITTLAVVTPLALRNYRKLFTTALAYYKSYFSVYL
jgi:hypothetical protein